MTETTSSGDPVDAWGRLVERLDSLEPGDRQTTIARLLSTLEEAGVEGRSRGDHEDNGMGKQEPLMICRLACDAGRDGTTQHLSLDVVPGPTQVPKTRSATGWSLMSNGHLGVDILHIRLEKDSRRTPTREITCYSCSPDRGPSRCGGPSTPPRQDRRT